MGAFGVCIGAFGAHALKTIIESNDRIATWETAMQYYWIHTLAILILSFPLKPHPLIRWVSFVWFVSVLLFSGSLFALSLGAPNIIGAITPLGGLGFIIGWLLLLKLPISFHD